MLFRSTVESSILPIKGIKIAYPSNAADMKGLMKSAFYDPNPVVMFEHKGLYWSKVPGTEAAKTAEPDEDYLVPFGKARVALSASYEAVDRGESVGVVTYGMGVYWATNAANATATGEDGWVTRDRYLGVFYPSGITTDLTGSEIVVPASHMMLRTFLRNDQVAYPWLAAAGTRRGTIDNANNIGYIDATTGEFQVVKNRMSIRDVLYTHQINPLAFFTGVGLLNYGNKSSFDSQSALDRINVARLICYIRERDRKSTRLNSSH